MRKNLKVEQGEATLRQMRAVARAMFTEHGYASVSTTQIVAETGVTRGALYHHFSGKEALFRAVVMDVQAEVGQRILAAAESAPDAWEQLTAGCAAFLRASLDPAYRQIVLTDGPAVLGRDEWRRIDEEATTSLLREQLEALVAQGRLPSIPVEALAHLLAGAMNEAVLWIAEADEPEAALQATLVTLQRLLEGLRGQFLPR